MWRAFLEKGNPRGHEGGLQWHSVALQGSLARETGPGERVRALERERRGRERERERERGSRKLRREER